MTQSKTLTQEDISKIIQNNKNKNGKAKPFQKKNNNPK